MLPPLQSYIILSFSILVQICIQIINLMHIKLNDYWKIMSLVFAIVVAAIIVVGTLCIMSNLYKKMILIL
jgi:heme/copper-type cytochrome/quinol oxidase subunit 4